jgi:hypothetical protein
MLKTAGAMLNGEQVSPPAEANGSVLCPDVASLRVGIVRPFTVMPIGVFCIFRGRRFYFC